MLFLTSDLESENVLNLFIYKGIDSVKFVNLVLRLFDEIDGISDSHKKLLTQHFIEGKTVSEIAAINKSKESLINTQIRKAIKSLLYNIGYLKSRANTAKIFMEKNWELENQVYDLNKRLDKVMDQLNRVKANPDNRDIIKILNTRFINLDMNVRIINCFKEADVDTIGDLLDYSCNELLRFRNFGKKSLEEVRELLKNYGYVLKE